MCELYLKKDVIFETRKNKHKTETCSVCSKSILPFLYVPYATQKVKKIRHMADFLQTGSGKQVLVHWA